MSTYACSVHHRTQGGAGVGRPTPPAGRAAPAAGFSPPVRVAPPEREARSLSATREARAKRGRIFYTRTHLKNLPPPSQAPRPPRGPPADPRPSPRARDSPPMEISRRRRTIFYLEDQAESGHRAYFRGRAMRIIRAVPRLGLVPEIKNPPFHVPRIRESAVVACCVS